MNGKRLGAITFLLFAAFIAGVTYLREPEPEPAPIDEESADTGMSASQREALMRTIGYVQ